MKTAWYDDPAKVRRFCEVAPGNTPEQITRLCPWFNHLSGHSLHSNIQGMMRKLRSGTNIQPGQAIRIREVLGAWDKRRRQGKRHGGRKPNATTNVVHRVNEQQKNRQSALAYEDRPINLFDLWPIDPPEIEDDKPARLSQETMDELFPAEQFEDA